MNDKAFLDSNILIYFYTNDDIGKRQKVCNIIDATSCITSTQALNEVSNVWYKKFNLNGNKIKNQLDNIELICDEVLAIQRHTINSAIDIKDRYGCSYYDSLMLASALESKCSTIYSEDMKNGQVINNTLTITNPF